MQQVKWLAVMAAMISVVALSGCGSNKGSSFSTLTTAQTTIVAGEAATLNLSNNLASVTFPAGCFSRSTIALISTDLAPASASSDKDIYLTYYPTATKQLTDLIAGIVINTPVDRLYHDDINVKMYFFDGFSRIPGDQYLLYRFDFNNVVWTRMGNLAATVDPGGATASVTLPTNGFRGFIGTLALFKGLTPVASPAYTPATISGTVTDESGNPLSTDVGLYSYVGTVQFPLTLDAGTGAHIPSGGLYRNTINSGVDGKFTITLPDIMIGQQVNLEFGREDPDYIAQSNIDIISPQYTNLLNQLFTNLPDLTLSYGPNVIQSRPVRPGTSVEVPITVPEGGN